MNIFEAYELSEWTKSFFKGLIKDFRIINEKADENQIVFWFESENGGDGLPITEGPTGGIYRGEYYIGFKVDKNTIYFRYRPSGSNAGILANSYIGVDGNGDAIFSNPKNMFDLMKIKKEWNDDFRNKELAFDYFPTEHYSHNFLIFEFFVSWDFNKNDIVDIFKEELPKSMNTILSEEMKDMLKKLSIFRVPGEKL